jgi:hypothetical protein
MPADATVWMVRLDRGLADDDVQGTLAMADDAVVFTDSRSSVPTRFPLAGMRKPKRVRGSPILILVDEVDPGIRRTAFYFSQPPPLHPPEPGTTSLPGAGLNSRPMGPFGAMRRTSKRRHMRTNIGYLATMNATHKTVIDAWVAEIGARIGAG